MPPSLQLLRFDPVQALRRDAQDGTEKRLIFYRSVAVDAVDEHGMTLFAHAARAGDEKAVRCLLDRGADPNAADRAGLTPLMHLAKGPADWKTRPKEIASAVQALLEAGADADAVDDGCGKSAAFFAIDGLVTPFFRTLAQKGLVLDERLPGNGFTLLHALCDGLGRITDLPEEAALDAEAEALVVAKMLVEKLGVERDALTLLGRTARELAVDRRSRLVAAWLRYGDGVFGESAKASLQLLTGGATACEAAWLRDEVKIRALLVLGEAGDEPETQGPHAGLTPLSCAASRMAVGVMSALLKAGADPTARVNGKSSGGRSTEGTSAMRMLLWAPQSPTSLPSGLTAQDWRQALEQMLAKPGAADAPVDADGLTPLLTLANNAARGWRAGDAEWPLLAAEVLLAHGADPNARMNAEGISLPFVCVPGLVTPLGLLARSGCPVAARMARLLLKAGAAPDLADKHGTTPLMSAAGLSSPAEADVFTSLLLKAGADPTLKDDQGRTAIDIASAAGCAGVLEKLLSAAAARTEAQTAEETQPVEEAKPRETSAVASERAGASSGSFFDCVRAKSASSSLSSPEKPLSAAMPQSEHGQDENPTTGGRRQAADFFSRMRSRTVPQTPPSADETLSEEAAAALPLDAMEAFLSAAILPLKRGKTELRMAALGIYSEGAAGNADALARRTADWLMDAGAAAEVDWKTEPEDFCFMLEGLVNFAPVREAGFERVPLAADEDDDVPAMARRFNEASELWGWPVMLAALGMNADSWILMLFDKSSFAGAVIAARRAGLKLADASSIG